MKKYIDQIFEEGLANTIYIPLTKKIKKMNNKRLSRTVNIIWKISGSTPTPERSGWHTIPINQVIRVLI